MRLNTIGTAIETLAGQCEGIYKKQLSMCPNSIHTLRRYAAFMTDVLDSHYRAIVTWPAANWQSSTPTATGRVLGDCAGIISDCVDSIGAMQHCSNGVSLM